MVPALLLLLLVGAGQGAEGFSHGPALGWPRRAARHQSPAPRVGLNHRAVPSAALDIGTSLTTALAFGNGDIQEALKVATFAPQPFWLLMILLPKTEATKRIMGSWYPLLGCSLVHLFIVIVSASQDNGTAPILEFADVFDPAKNTQDGMVGMMRYPNFVSEEWSHVLTWDLFVGRWIWLDGLKRGVFTPHSVLLCNLIGPPGLLLHTITCILSGKQGLPLPDESTMEDGDSQ